MRTSLFRSSLPPPRKAKKKAAVTVPADSNQELMRQPKIVLGRRDTSPTFRITGWHLHPYRTQATSILTRGSRLLSLQKQCLNLYRPLSIRNFKVRPSREIERGRPVWLAKSLH